MPGAASNLHHMMPIYNRVFEVGFSHTNRKTNKSRTVNRYDRAKSSKYSDVGTTPVSSRCSLALVHAT